ncbi:Bromodomain protein [Aphelenchoides fujianensis]|nr:Bromodomain protein [Aphelenchoides fujianensis]
MSERRRSLFGAPPTRRNGAPATKRQKLQEDESTKEDESESNSDGEETNDSQSKEPAAGSPDRKPRKKRRVRLTNYDSKKRAERRQREIERKEMMGEGAESPPKREKEVVEEPKKPEVAAYTPFQQLCECLIQKFIAKDPEEFFTTPVQPSVAPDYFKIINTPMDFSAMQKKLDRDEYASIEDLRKDVQLIAENAMAYNKPNTVYYLAAQKLLAVAKYYFSEAFLEYLRYHLPYGNEIPHEVLGLKPKVAVRSTAHVHKRDPKLEALRNAISDKADPKALLSQADAAHRDKLSTAQPKWHLGFVDPKAEGGVALNILTGEEKAPPCLPSYEPVEKFDSPITYMNSGPFCSFAPQFDSTWASLNKRDSDLLLGCYGDKQNTIDALSLRQMASEAGFTDAIDGILDVLTDGEHSRTLGVLKDGASRTEVDENQKTESTEVSEEQMKKLIDEVETLANLGLDVSFLKNVRSHLGLAEEETAEKTVDETLEQTGQMLADLNTLQQQRLNANPPLNLAEIPPPQPAEEQLAQKVVKSLASGVSEFGVPPGKLASTAAIHQAVGLNETDDYDDDLLQEFMDIWIDLHSPHRLFIASIFLFCFDHFPLLIIN